MNKIATVIIAALVAGALPSLPMTPAAAQEAPMLLPVDETPLSIRRDGREVARFDIEIADDREERARGLMFRTEFPDDRAMLFVFERTRDVSFWMHNTPRSLDMLFVRENGVVATIARNTTPFSRTPVPSGEPVRYVLEINAGMADSLGILPGDRLVHPIISVTGE
ncbi:DUF192 domain-containing protein [Oricola thermophila]|uniref:DUF192 domain-containing protein n=1 Tax=Oricola thermophila TaxID=2742145 RepID=A0A6N1VAM8_9HYPH|nr:DUF192 domain-containing protein [Oricola thermophila]QKV18061.1 DUF192 domain-containing protein [Oricola thermophila]